MRFGWSFRVGDKIMQMVNDYGKDVFNSDAGFIQDIDTDAQEVMVDFDGRLVAYGFGELDEVMPAYATSIHKAQGSEYAAVVIPQHYVMLRRNLVYTAITRGKELVVLVGQRKALRIAVNDFRSERRSSKLNRWRSETVE